MQQNAAAEPETLAHAQALFHQQRYDEALILCNKLARAHPKNAETLRLKGILLIKLQQTTKAEKTLRALLKSDPKDAKTMMALAFMFENMNRHDKALALFKKVLELTPQDQAAHFHKALMLERLNQTDGAEQAAKDGLEIFPNHPGLLYVLALTLRRSKNYEEAIHTLQSMDENPQTPSEFIANKYFELGQNYDRLGKHDDAFTAFTTAQKHRQAYGLARGTLGNKTLFTTVVQFYRDQFSQIVESFPQAEDPAGEKGPYFFIGFPRSGTTLLHHMLQAHPDVKLLEEEPFVKDIHNELAGANLCAPEQSITPALIKKLRTNYRQKALKHMGQPPKKLYIDKLPLNTVYLPLLTWLFPQAKFIIGLRHPCDCCLSCLMQNFDSNSAMENLTNLDDITALYANTMTIYEHEKQKAPERFMEVKYENMIENTEEELKEICTFLNIDWHEDLLHYREKMDKTKITTASFRQIVEPIYKHAQYRWKNYAPYLAPYLNRLEPYIEKFGYEA